VRTRRGETRFRSHSIDRFEGTHSPSYGFAKLLLKPLKSYTNEWVASMSFARDVTGGRKSRPSAIAMVAHNCTAKKRSVISLLSPLFFIALCHRVEHNPFSLTS